MAEPVVKRVDDAGADGAVSAIVAAHDLNEGILRGGAREDLGCLVRRPVVDDEPGGRLDALRADRLEGGLQVRRFVAAG